MTIADSRVVAWHTDDFATDKSATTYDKVVAARWVSKGWPVTPLVHESLLAEAEMISANRLLLIGLIEKERDALQSRLDTVVAAVAKHRDTFPDEALPSERELWESVAALGCATTGEEK